MRIVFCADVHLGATKNFTEILGCFEMMIQSCDMLVIGGDLFDSKVYASSDEVKQVIELFEFLTPIAKAGNKIIRVIYGTLSHDGYPQLQILRPYQVRMNLKIIDHVREEKINGLNFLYLPEEIIANKQEYYANTLYSGKKYDYIFGHGVIAEGMPMVKPSIKKVKAVPIFKTEELRQATRFHTIFGHYHRNIEFGNVAYVGSLSRFKHGEPEPKGWYYLDGKERTFVKNPWCPLFTEIKINALEYSLDDFQNKILLCVKKFKEISGDYNKLKFSITMDRKNEHALGYLDILRSLSKIQNVSYAVRDVNDVTAQEEIKQTEYDYIMDPNVPIRDKILRYNDTEFEGEVDPELLDQYLSKLKLN